MSTKHARPALIALALTLVITMLAIMAGPPPTAMAQTPEPTSIPHVVAVDVGGQWVLIDYSVTAGEFFIGSVLTFMVLLQVLLLVVFAYRKRYQ